MNVIECDIADVKIVELDIYRDERGFFAERFHAEKFAALGLPTHFPQINHSLSNPGVLRGLHYQHAPAQGKLVGVPRGRIWDVAVDIRPESASFGQHVGFELSADNARLLWIPPGFAHGFCVLGDEPADVVYYVTELYSAAGENGMMWNDPTLNIDWPIASPNLSDRDIKQPSFTEYKNIEST